MSLCKHTIMYLFISSTMYDNLDHFQLGAKTNSAASELPSLN